jgi:hypothetical protein
MAGVLRGAQMSLYMPGADSFAIPLEKIREQCGAERAELLQLFCSESAVTHGGFTMRYEPEHDRVHFKRISRPTAAAAPASPLAQVAAQPAPVAITPNVDRSMSQEQIAAVAKTTWAQNPKLHREVTSEGAYVAFCKAEASGRARIFGRPTA